MGFGLVIGFIDHLQIVITSNHIALTNSRTRLLTAVHTKSSTSTLRVAWQRLLSSLTGGRSVSVTLLLTFASHSWPVSSRYMTHDFCSLLDMYVFRNGASSSREEESVSLCRCFVCCTVVSTKGYWRCYGVQGTMDCASFVIAVY
jgi:hypothetical protein